MFRIHLHIDRLHVERIENTSGVFSGRNIQLGFTSSKQISEGFGSVSGEGNEVVHGIHGAAKIIPKEAEDYGGEQGSIL